MIKETVILAPGANKTELIRSLALHGKGSFGLRIYSSAFSLAQDMLVRKGKLNYEVVSDAEIPYIISGCMRTVPAFNNASFTDAINIANSIKTLRNLIISDEENQMERLISESDFNEKNESFLKVYEKYRGIIRSRKDRIDVIREAINENYESQCEFVKLGEFPLLPLEEALLNKLSNNNVKKMTLIELFGADESNDPDITYIRAYGNSNEVENTLNHIFENSIPLDDCVIAVSNPEKYNQLLLEYSQKYGLNMTFSNGININNTNPARLLKLYYRWDAEGYHGVDPLMNMLYSPCFDLEKLKGKFGKDVAYPVLKNTINRVGQLKFESSEKANSDKAENCIALLDEKEKKRIDVDVIRVLAKELGRDCVSFINEYSVIKDGNDEEALRSITDTIIPYLHYCHNGKYTDVISNILSLNVGKSVSSEGSLIVTDIKGALSVYRNNLFVIGLSADNFPGNVKENYLLLDDDLGLYGKEEDNIPFSHVLIKRKKESLENLLAVNSALLTRITLSYSCYEMAEIKQQNASSVLFDIYQKLNQDKTIDDFENVLKDNQTAYLQNGLSLSSQVLNALDSDQILKGIPKGNIIDEPFAGKRAFSPSALEAFFCCPKRFYLKSILNIKEPDPDDPLEVINARDMGTLVHTVMEELSKKKGISKQDFIKMADEMFSDYLKTRTPVNDESAEKAREEFLDMAGNGFEHDPGNEVLAAEERIYVKHDVSGIMIYGYPDRVEKDGEGKYLIADYKTKRNYDHQEDDINSCLQVVLYAYMISHRTKNPLPVSYCTYRYLRYSKPVNCVYNQDMENKLSEMLLLVRDALDSGYFP